MTDQKDIVDISYQSEEKEPEKERSGRGKHAKPGGRHKSVEREMQAKVEKLQENLEKIVQERDEYKDKYLRNLAEIDNFRKRVKKEKEEFQRYVLGDFILDLLEVYDNFERALKAGHSVLESEDCAAEATDKSILSGIEIIYKQLSELLKKNNVEEIEALGKPFDPNLHQALAKEEVEDLETAKVMEVYQKGFFYNQKLLRPVLAKIAIPADGDQESPERS